MKGHIGECIPGETLMHFLESKAHTPQDNLWRAFLSFAQEGETTSCLGDAMYARFCHLLTESMDTL